MSTVKGGLRTTWHPPLHGPREADPGPTCARAHRRDREEAEHHTHLGAQAGGLDPDRRPLQRRAHLHATAGHATTQETLGQYQDQVQAHGG